MFTGIIEEVGRIAEVTSGGSDIRLVIRAGKVLAGVQIGDSIAVDGVCLTVEKFAADWFTVYASPETMKKTSLGERAAGDGVNLERALALGDRLGGHLVSGHVDTTGEFVSARSVERAYELRIAAPPEITRHSIPKGSITVDGISLTIVELTGEEFTCWIIPETWKKTTLIEKRAGQKVNLESDLIGKYVARFLEVREGGPDPAERDRGLRALLEGGNWGAR